MKVQELRDLLKTTDRETLEKAFLEIYKQFSKAKKEDVIDQLITDTLAHKEKSPKTQPEISDFPKFKATIQYFIENAYQQNYFAPNRIISKSQRPKWRFLVKDYIKQLEKVPREDVHYPDAVALLKKLYEMLCYGCCYYIFSTENPFRSVGIQQTSLFQAVLSRVFSLDYSEASIKNMLLLATKGQLDNETLDIELELILTSALKTRDLKHAAIKTAKACVAELEGKHITAKSYGRESFDNNRQIDELCRTILLLGLALQEPDEEIKYYFKHNKERDKEIALYVVLDTIRIAGWDELWIQTYESALRAKIKPRETLQKCYAELKMQE